jgi:hypothetical protein
VDVLICRIASSASFSPRSSGKAGRKDENPKTLHIITVLFADKYIHLAPRRVFFIEPDDDYYQAVEAHFISRGIDHVRDEKPVEFREPQFPKNAITGQQLVAVNKDIWTFNQDAWILTEKAKSQPYGSTNKTTSQSNVRAFGRKLANSPLSVRWDPSITDFSVSPTPADDALAYTAASFQSPWTTGP